MQIEQIEIPRPLLPLMSCGLLAGTLVSAQGCDGLGDLADQCGLVCPDTGIVEGNASISGVVSLDAFFSAVLTVRDASADVASSMRAELEGIAASLEIEGYAEMSLDQLTTAVVGGLQAKFDANLQGGLTITFTPARCEANIELALEAAAECDVEATPGELEVECQGKCEVTAEVAAECAAMGTLECTGTAPDFECEGACQGSCQLDVAASCSGTCSGECDGACSSCVGGNCDVQGNVTMNCNGSCMGSCTGTCELEAAGTCEGRCEGSCTYTPAMGGCEADATAKCDVSGMADVECAGKCEGTVEPPMVSAECQATVDATANAEIVCTPPSLDVRFAFADGLDADAQAEFKAWLEGFKTRFAAMAAIRGKLDGVRLAAEGLITASVEVIPGVIDELEAEGGLELDVAVGIGCALVEAEQVGVVLDTSVADLGGSLDAFARVSGTVAS
jgi:hypothetical protein